MMMESRVPVLSPRRLGSAVVRCLAAWLEAPCVMGLAVQPWVEVVDEDAFLGAASSCTVPDPAAPTLQPATHLLRTGEGW